MILAGIDEAGYGPVLGPLVVGCCAFEVEEEAGGGEWPCLWKRLKRVARRVRDKTGAHLHINDSKAVYSPAAGVKELERSVLAVSRAMGLGCEHLDEWLESVAGADAQEVRSCAWYERRAEERFPVAQEEASIRIMANALRVEMERSKARCIHLGARVISERRLNAMLEQTRNKSSVLFSLAACHLDRLLREHGSKGLVIVCDRQGGREHYGHLLRLMFGEWALEVTEEKEGRSEYRLSRGADTVRLMFREKAEAQCMPVALASMVSKYAREALMGRFNAYWRAMLPEIEPTAGYYTDGMRFLAGIESKRRELGIRDEDLIRSR